MGFASAGAGLWGQVDLAGDEFEWNLDWYATYASRTDCANFTTASDRVFRGGSFFTTACGYAASMTPRRRKVALAIAALADAVQLGFFPVFGAGALSVPDDMLDFVVAVTLVITLGWRWRLVAAMALELVPGVALFPSWTAFVAMLPARPVAAGPPSSAPAAADPPSPPSRGSP